MKQKKQKKQISKRSKIIFVAILVAVVTIINAVLCDEGERFDGLVRVMTESLDKMEYVTSAAEIPAQAMAEMQAVAEKQFRDYIGDFAEYRLDEYQYLGNCFLSIKKKDKTKAKNELYLLYRAKLTIQVSEEEEKSYDWFYYVSFTDIQAGKNEAYAVNMEVYNTPSWKDSPNNHGYSYVLQSATRSLCGYKSLEALCNRLNSSQTQKYYNVEENIAYAQDPQAVSAACEEQMKTKAEETLAKYTDWSWEWIVPPENYEYLGSYAFVANEGLAKDGHENDFYMVYRVQGMIEGKGDFAFYSFARLSNLLQLPDGTWNMDWVTCSKPSNQYKPFSGGYFLGYETLEQMENALFAWHGDNYTCVKSISE